jgi:hypothetical protein
MSRQVSNVDIITDSFEIWLLETNELLNALSTEILTANVTYANTGNSTVSRTAQLWGQFGANNLVVSNWLKGGNVNGQYANLMISTNTMVSNNNAANLNSMVINSSSFSYITPIGGYFGNTIANSTINTTSIITQSNTTVNTNIIPTRVQVINSTSSANMTPTSFKTGIFTGNTIEMSVGANVVANATSFLVNGAYSYSLTDATQLTTYSANSTSNGQVIINVQGNSTGSIEIGGTVGGLIDFKSPLADDYDYRFLSNTSGLYIIGGSSTSTANVIYVNSANLNVDSGTLFVDQINNRVGINTTIPIQALDVVGNAVLSGQSTADQYFRIGQARSGNGNSYIDLQGDATYTGGLRLIRADTGANANSSMIHRGTGALTIQSTEAAPIVVLTTELERVRVLATGEVGIGTATPTNKLSVAGNIGLQTSGYIAFSATVASAANYSLYGDTSTTTLNGPSAGTITFDINNVEQMRLVANGNFGIGTNLPTRRLSVTTNINGNEGLTVTNSNTGASAQTTISINAQGWTGLQLVQNQATGLVTLYNGDNTSMALSTNALERMRIDSGGNTGIGNTTPDAKLAVTGTANVSGAARFANTFSVIGTSSFGNTITIQNENVIDVSSNANIGTFIGLIPIYSFPKATYSSGKFTVQVKNTGNTQIADMLIAHDNTTAYVTVFGTVASPNAANGSVSPLGNFVANVNGSNIDLLINQTIASSAVKIIANLIK